MTTEFVDLPALAARPFAVARLLLSVASDALDAVGVKGVDRRFVSPVPPAWSCSMLAVYKARRYIGLAGSEQVGYPFYGDAVLGLHTALFTVLVVVPHAPVTERIPDKIVSANEDAAERLSLASAAIFHGLIQAHQTDQIETDGFHLMATGPDDTHPNNESGFIGDTITVAYQLI